MGTFHVAVEIGDPEGRRYLPIEALVDTGAAYTSVPRPLLETLGVEPHQRAWFQLADGRLVERAIGRAWVRVGERAEQTLVVFADPDSPALLGAYSLEGLRLAPDPVGRRLVPVSRLFMSLVPS
jgi:aspartyl protease family protein